MNLFAFFNLSTLKRTLLDHRARLVLEAWLAEAEGQGV